MKLIECSGVIFLDSNNRVLLEDRRRIKKHGEHWSFFGGTKEKDESVEQCLLREIKEELGLKLVDYNFFIKHKVNLESFDLIYHMYLAPLPDLKTLKVHKMASFKVFTIKQALRLKITDADKFILQKLLVFLTKQK